LLPHRCINFRHGAAGLYLWKFEKGKKPLSVAVTGPLIVDDLENMVRAAIDGVGLAFISDERVEQQLESGELVRVLEDWPAVSRIFSPLSKQAATASGSLGPINTLRQ
jgi:DNA-binding transcriptional LysR family regulator